MLNPGLDLSSHLSVDLAVGVLSARGGTASGAGVLQVPIVPLKLSCILFLFFAKLVSVLKAIFLQNNISKEICLSFNLN